MRVSGRAAMAAPGGTAAGLPVDIAFLAGFGLAPSVLAAIAARASRLGVAPSREIIASGLISEETFYRALAHELGLAFHAGRLALSPGGGYGAILREGVAVVAASSRTCFRFALAPEGRALHRLLLAGPRSRDDIVVMTPGDFAASLRAANGPALARHLAGLDQAGLARDSARTGSSRGQQLTAGIGVAVTAVCGTLAPLETFFAWALLLCPLFLGLIYLRLAAIVEPARIDLWTTQRWRIDDSRLPVYTVAVPLYREEAVLPQLIAALSALDYPAAKLDILLLTEADDAGMAAALARLELPPGFTVAVVPPGHPRTKPRALNLALVEARGELFTIFDAEDIPDPRQLRLAAARFLRGPPELACLQARLVINYAGEGLLPALFALEYAGLFGVLNPGLLRYRLPIMLGGTSNHFRGLRQQTHQTSGWISGASGAILSPHFFERIAAIFHAHWSSCALHSGPAEWPVPCDCSGFRGDKEAASGRWGCSPVEALGRWLQLWQARLVWRSENHASWVLFLMFAMRLRSELPSDYSLPHEAQPSEVRCHSEMSQPGALGSPDIPSRAPLQPSPMKEG